MLLSPETSTQETHTATLVKMANQIAQFFAAMPQQEQARKDWVSHLRNFWTPRMREQFLHHIDQAQDASALHPLVRQALEEELSSLCKP